MRRRNGTVWIDMAGGGRILKTELRMESAGAPRQTVRMRTAVTYARVDKLGSVGTDGHG